MTDLPLEQVWETCYGPVLGLRIPTPIFDISVKLGVHHLEDLVTKSGTAVRTADAVALRADVTKPQHPPHAAACRRTPFWHLLVWVFPHAAACRRTGF